MIIPLIESKAGTCLHFFTHCTRLLNSPHQTQPLEFFFSLLIPAAGILVCSECSAVAPTNSTILYSKDANRLCMSLKVL